MFGFILGLFKKSQKEFRGRVKACPYCNANFNDETELEIHIGGQHPAERRM